MTSSNGNIFCVTRLLCGEYTGQRWIARTKASNVSQERTALGYNLSMNLPCTKSLATYRILVSKYVYLIIDYLSKSVMVMGTLQMLSTWWRQCGVLVAMWFGLCIKTGEVLSIYIVRQLKDYTLSQPKAIEIMLSSLSFTVVSHLILRKSNIWER